MRFRHFFTLITITLTYFTASCFPSQQPGDPTSSRITPEPPPEDIITETEAKITEPSEKEEVSKETMVKGSSQGVPKDSVIWVVVYPYQASRYYPQNKPTDVQSNGKWASMSYIGIDEDVKQKFDLIVVVADETAQEAFESYLEKAKDKKDWAGLEQLPDGAEILDRLMVIRK